MRFGSPTKAYGSGTEEEFILAHNAFVKDPESLQILFYFKTSLPNSIKDINPEQLLKVRDFQNSLGEKNVLYWEFGVKEELQKFLRIHIPKRIDGIRNSLPKTYISSSENIAEITVNDFEDELGTLDYQEIYSEGILAAVMSLRNISDATEWIANQFNKNTKEINVLLKSNNNQPLSNKVQRNIYDKTARAMTDFANRIDPEIKIFSENSERGMDAFSNLIMLYKTDFNGARDEDVEEAKDSLANLLIQISGTIESSQGFLQSIINMPRVSKEFNKAKRIVEDKLRSLINKIETSHSLANEVYKSL